MQKLRRVFTAVVAAVVLGVTAVGVAPASAQPEEPNASQFCREFEEEIEGFISVLVGFPVDLSHGACVAFLAAENPSPGFASVCQSLPEQSGEEVKVGQCIQLLRAIFGGGENSQ